MISMYTGRIQYKILLTIANPFFFNLRVSKTRNENLKQPIRRDIIRVTLTFKKFVALLAQKLRWRAVK